ncbi:MAG: hypothetical protein AAF628_28690 [Planctomycetota bacterium]
MARRHLSEDSEPRRFPLAVTVLCGGAALALFFFSTVPAVTERDRLRGLEASRQDLLDILQQESATQGATAAALEVDPQAVLVELDKLQLTPGDLLEEDSEGRENDESDRSSR